MLSKGRLPKFSKHVFLPMIAIMMISIGIPATLSGQAFKPQDKWLDNGLPDDLLSKSDEKKKALPPDGIPRPAKVHLTQKIIPALKSGDDDAFLHAMFTLITKQPEQVVDAVEKYGAKNLHGSFKAQFSDALIRSVARGMLIDSRKLKPALVQFATTGLMDKIEDQLDELDKHILMQDPLALPFDWFEKEKVFWDVHVWENRFTNLERLLTFTQQVQKPLLDKAIKSNVDDEIEKYRKAHLLAQRISSTRRDMLERQAELRVQALGHAESTLRLAQDPEDLINAAFALEMHGGELSQLFKKRPPGSYTRERLNDPGLLVECEKLMTSGRESGKAVIEKAMLLRLGAHWWLRGRYGKSSQAFGLLKPKAAMNNEQAMFGLFMPQSRPEAIGFINSDTGAQSEGYDRRHYYTWAIERRDLIDRRSYPESPSDLVVSQDNTVKSHRFW